MRHELRNLIFGAVLASLLILLALTMQIIESYQNKISETERNANNLSHLLEVQTTGTFRGLEAMLSGLVQNMTDRTPRGERLRPTDHETLMREVGRYPEINAVRIFDKSGACVLASDLKECKINIRGREFYQTHSQNASYKTLISKPLVSRVDGTWILILSRRISDVSGNFAGVALIDIPIKDFERLYSSVDVGPNGNITIFTADDKTLTIRHPVLENKIGVSFAQSEFFRAIERSRNKSGTVRVRGASDGKEKLFSYRTLEPLNLIVVVGLAESDFLQNWLIKSIVLATFTILLLFCLAYMLYRHLKDQAAIGNGRLQLAKSAKMSALGEMASAVAHEINNPLAIISGNADMLRELKASSSDDQELIEKRVEKIEKTVSRIAKIVTGLKVFSRSGEDDPFEYSSVEQIVEQTLEMCRSKLEANRITLKVDFANTSSSMLECRSVQISQVLLNLISNSADAVMALSNPWIEIKAHVIDERLRIEVTDSGSGIPANVVERMMQPFFTTKAVGRGTGLGLSISKGLIESHGGSLTYDDSSRHTRFTVTLPLRQTNTQISRAA